MRCLKNVSGLAVLNTAPVTNIGGTIAVSGGNIVSDGLSPVTQRGVVWSTTPNPTSADNILNYGSGTGSFISSLSGLTTNTIYYVRAYAINANGTAYGNEVSFTTASPIISNPGAGVTFNGYTYNSIVLGNGQEWMAENLRTSTYANGDPIPNVTDAIQWDSLTTGAWAHYNNDSQIENPYGKLYNWYTVIDSRNLCPTGWHVPSDTEWTVLTDYLWGYFVAGGKMKITGTQYWASPNIGATNESGFSSLPGGRHHVAGTFSGIGYSGLWWSTTEVNSSNAWYRVITFDNEYVSRQDGQFITSNIGKTSGFSVRCLKD